MTLTTVITGDMINSKSLSPTERERFINLLSNLGSFLLPVGSSNVEIFRGDSFQFRINNPFDSLYTAIMIRSLFRSQGSDNGDRQWDCRISVGIGHTEFEKSTPGTSDGEAYRLSGYGLDEMKKKRLTISTPWREINEELEVTTAFADDIISHWTVKQSDVVFNKLSSRLNNYEVAATLGISRQSVDKLTNAARYSLIELYLNRFGQLLALKI